ncbi:MAG: trypsin-like peptidase domain-containing protein [Planctomycetales bacterium]
MKRHLIALCAATALGWSWFVSAGEVIELKSGYSIEGEVIAERSTEIIVDIGVDILRIPLDQIARRTSADAKPTEQTGPEDGFYHIGAGVKSTVRDLAAQFGGGVVMVRTPSGSGSGFIINDKGYCITNHHVIENEKRISVTIYEKDEDRIQPRRVEEVAIIALNPFLDLALLRIPAADDMKFSAVGLAATEDRLDAGDQVFAVGNPLGLERSVSQGIISNKNRNFRGLIYLQTTAEINPGNSGGPLFNLRGQVVGVTNMKILGGEGLGFAIPIAYVKHFLANRDAFAFDSSNPNNGHRYLNAPRRRSRRPAKTKSDPETE